MSVCRLVLAAWYLIFALFLFSWAHAGAQQMESDGMRLNGNPASLELSVQQLVSCDKGEGQHGCMGGLQEPGYDYVRDNGGIVTAQDYPYTEKTGRCDTSINNYVVGVTGYDFIIDNDVAVTEEQFTSYVLSTGTLSIGVDATTWSTYKSGVMSDCGKGTDINHAVQIVGVDNSESGWWKVCDRNKNSSNNKKLLTFLYFYRSETAGPLIGERREASVCLTAPTPAAWPRRADPTSMCSTSKLVVSGYVRLSTGGGDAI